MTVAKTAPSDTASRFLDLTATDIKRLTDSGSFSRGRACFRDGRIHDTVLRDNAIEGLCEGSDYLPYRVQTTLPLRRDSPLSRQSAACSCPVDGFCKHLVALCLAWIDDPGRFVERPPLADLLAERQPEDLIALILRMVDHYPELERLVDVPVVQIGEAAANEVTIDEEAFRRRAQAEYARVDTWDYWDGPVPGATDVYSLLELGQAYVQAKQWANAQAVLTILFEETGDTVLTIVDDDGEPTNIISECDAGLSACLAIQVELPEEEHLAAAARQRLIRTLYDIWQFDMFEAGGVGIAHEGPNAIAHHVTAEERAVVEAWLRAEEPNEWNRRLVTGFLIMLSEEAGLDDEHLLAIYRETELWDDVVGMLLKMDRIDEAVVVAGHYLQEPHGLLGFADALIERGGEHVARAITFVDDRVWEAEGKNPAHDVQLQEWLVARLSEHQRPRDALAIAERRFRAQPSMKTWQAVRQAAELPGQAPEVWRDLRPGLLAQLRKQKAWSTLMEIHLEDGDVADAIDAYGKRNDQVRTDRWHTPDRAAPDQDLRLAAACEAEFPDQAIAIYRFDADRMIANRQRVSYTVAAEHLARVKATLERHGRAAEWAALIAEVRTANKTLRALREELDALDL